MLLLFFMMQRLKAMSLIIQSNTNIVELFENVAMGVDGIKYSCSTTHNNTETPVPQLDMVKRLTCLVTDLKDPIHVQLDHDPNI